MKIERIVQRALQIGGNPIVSDGGRRHHHRNTCNEFPPFAIGTRFLKERNSDPDIRPTNVSEIATPITAPAKSGLRI
jgi:hypothetical protein